ncbi:PEP-CTERM sorting domain-containing protein [Akkermansia muciniphila]|uniref:PEP-CTERM sorting domain-containing protein n=1 Tax=Akkermansia muciniphila TaxID=239935 RepID=UPI00319E8B88
MNTSNGSFTQNRGDVSETSVVLNGGLLNVTLSVTGADQSQSVDVYVNGSLFDTLSYNGNMNGNRNPIASWINPDLTWGEVKWTDETLGAEQIAGFAGLQVPEPASASLGILGLAVLMMRRRRL